MSETWYRVQVTPKDFHPIEAIEVLKVDGNFLWLAPKGEGGRRTWTAKCIGVAEYHPTWDEAAEHVRRIAELRTFNSKLAFDRAVENEAKANKWLDENRPKEAQR